MSEPEIFIYLRGLLTDAYNIKKLAKKADIPPMKLYRFKKKTHPLSVADADKLCVVLTGKTFIQTPDELR